jgi:hypothetical protein
MSDKDYGIVAATGCATGFIWSAFAGNADLSTKEGWKRALLGCVGSSINSTSIFLISDKASGNSDLAWKITSAWWGIQGAAGLTNWIGRKRGWADEPAFNAVALPLNYAASPLMSTIGLIYGGIAFAFVDDPSKHVRVYRGILTFNHQPTHPLPGYKNAFALGAIGIGVPMDLRKHESGHVVQFSILGDLGMAIIYSGDFLLSKLRGKGYPDTIFEHWATDIYGRELDTNPAPYDRPIRCRANGNGNHKKVSASPKQIENAAKEKDPKQFVRLLIHSDPKVRRSALTLLMALDNETASTLFDALKAILKKYGKPACLEGAKINVDKSDSADDSKQIKVKEMRHYVLDAIRQLAISYPRVASNQIQLNCPAQDIIGWQCDAETYGKVAATLAALLPHANDPDAMMIFEAIPRFVAVLDGPQGSLQLSDGLFEMAKSSRFAAEKIVEALLHVGETSGLNNPNASRLIRRLMDEKIVVSSESDKQRIDKLDGLIERDNRRGWYAGISGGWNYNAAEKGLAQALNLWISYRNYHHLELRWNLNFGWQEINQGSPSDDVGTSIEPVFHLSHNPKILDPYLSYEFGVMHFMNYNTTALTAAIGAGLQIHVGSISFHGVAKARGNIFPAGKPDRLSTAGGSFEIGASYRF